MRSIIIYTICSRQMIPASGARYVGCVCVLLMAATQHIKAISQMVSLQHVMRILYILRILGSLSVSFLISPKIMLEQHAKACCHAYYTSLSARVLSREDDVLGGVRFSANKVYTIYGFFAIIFAIIKFCSFRLKSKLFKV